MNALIDYKRLIVQEHEAAQRLVLNAEKQARAGLEHAFRAGELLLETKASAEHGDWGSFCACLPFSPTAARGYMRLASLSPEERQRVADLPLRQALLEIARPRRALLAPRPIKGKKADRIRAELGALDARRRVSSFCEKAKHTLIRVAAQPTFSDDERQAIDGLRAAIEACEARLSAAASEVRA